MTTQRMIAAVLAVNFTIVLAVAALFGMPVAIGYAAGATFYWAVIA